MPPIALAGAALAALLFGWGVWIDRTQPLPQTALFAALQLASLGGAALGLALGWRRADTPARRALFALGALLAWRLAYFPLMVFSGHVASVGEWVLAATGLLPILVYPVFLLSVAVLHVGVAFAATLVVAPPRPWMALAVAPAFLVAAFVSFGKPSDLAPLPDRFARVDGPVPAPRAPLANPYLPALVGPGYLPNQRIMLVAAGLTYETIPPSPWARTVKAVLEGLFVENPSGSTADRVLEHYQAYRSAHPWIGCRRFADCPIP